MSTDNIVVSTNVVQSVTNNTTNIVAYDTVVHEPIITGSQGPQGPQGLSATTNMAGLTDVSLDNLTDGSMLIYSTDTQVWTATTQLNKQALECGQY